MSIKVKRSRAQPIAQLLTKSGGVGQLMRQSRLIDQAQRHLRAHLPEEMREHIFVGGFSNGRLTLISGQASWLTWLRYEQSQLLSLLHQLPGFAGFKRCGRGGYRHPCSPPPASYSLGACRRKACLL